MDRISEKCEQITEEAERCVVMRPLNRQNNYVNEMWNRGWSSANDESTNQWKWHDYAFVQKGKFLGENFYDFPITYEALREMHKYFPIESAGYMWMMPQSHIPQHQVETKSGYLVVHMGLIVPIETSFSVSRSNYQYEKGKFIIFDDNDIHESFNRSKLDNCVILYVKAKNK